MSEKAFSELGVTVQSLWPQVVFAFWLRTLIELLVVVLLVVICLFASVRGLERWVTMYGKLREEQEKSDYMGDIDLHTLTIPIMKTIGFGILGILALCALVVTVGSSVATLFNPEGALILKALGK